MKQVLYSDIDLMISEYYKTITINPKGIRFYGLACEEQASIYRNATLSIDDDGRYVIEGTHHLYTEHHDMGFSYEKLLCLHPQELIKQRSFLGLISWYRVKGVMKREVHSRYIYKHKEYKIQQRLEFLSHTCQSEV
ncbi:MAG: hypothetical protein B7Y17_04960 [Sulfuricurvum sp. 24-42-5]|nr:MAG: hypothetical protein B7Y17_04960 [Sulfuricurvum sp. 24-42-5]